MNLAVVCDCSGNVVLVIWELKVYTKRESLIDGRLVDVCSKSPDVFCVCPCVRQKRNVTACEGARVFLPHYNTAVCRLLQGALFSDTQVWNPTTMSLGKVNPENSVKTYSNTCDARFEMTMVENLKYLLNFFKKIVMSPMNVYEDGRARSTGEECPDQYVRPRAGHQGTLWANGPVESYEKQTSIEIAALHLRRHKKSTER